MWDTIYEAEIISRLVEEAAPKEVHSDDDPTPEESTSSIETLIQGYQEGKITEEDLINMYKKGQLTQDDILQIQDAINGAEDENVSPEELFAQQIEQVNDNFIKFGLYDKINNLQEKLDDFLENHPVQDKLTTEVIQLNNFLKILNSLVFSLDTSVAYQLYGSIEIKLIELFKDIVGRKTTRNNDGEK